MRNSATPPDGNEHRYQHLWGASVPSSLLTTLILANSNVQCLLRYAYMPYIIKIGHCVPLSFFRVHSARRFSWYEHSPPPSATRYPTYSVDSTSSLDQSQALRGLVTFKCAILALRCMSLVVHVRMRSMDLPSFTDHVLMCMKLYSIPLSEKYGRH